MNFLRRRLYEDSYNTELRYYYLIELILNEKWNDLLDILEETPHIHLNFIQFAFKYIPLIMNNNERIEKLKQCLKSFEISRNEIKSLSSSSTSIQSLEQTILFLSNAKFYKKSFNWNKIGKGECEIIENNKSGEIFLRFWILKHHSINLVFLVHLNQSEN